MSFRYLPPSHGAFPTLQAAMFCSVCWPLSMRAEYDEQRQQRCSIVFSQYLAAEVSIVERSVFRGFFLSCSMSCGLNRRRLWLFARWLAARSA